MRKLALLVPVFALLFLVQFASAQQGDAMFGGGTIMSSGSCDPNTGICPEKGGFYPSVSADIVFHRRVGFQFETAWRASQATYGGPLGQPFRPILTDFNALYQPRVTKKVGLDLMGGIGWQSTRFYGINGSFSCQEFGSCFVSSHHFLIDAGGGIRYYVWGHFFVRPEIHYYWVNNNTNDFSSNNLFRAGASIGYTIGGPFE